MDFQSKPPRVPPRKSPANLHEEMVEALGLASAMGPMAPSAELGDRSLFDELRLVSDQWSQSSWQGPAGCLFGMLFFNHLGNSAT